MKSRNAALIALVLTIGLLGCATMHRVHHSYVMRGQVLQLTDGTAYVCVGTAEGAEAGQKLRAFRYVPVRLPAAPTRTGRDGPIFRQVETGTVTIIEVVDEHYALARVEAGDVNVGDTVELRSK